MIASLSIIDLVVLVITSIFVITAILRGFVGEIFSIFNLVATILAVIYIPPIIKPYVSGLGGNEMVIDIILNSAIFILSGIAFKIMTSGLRRSASFLMPAPIDYPLGVAFAIAKSFLIFGIIFSLAINIYSSILKQSKIVVLTNLPSWFDQSKSSGMIKFSGQILDPYVDQFLTKNFGNVSKAIDQDLLNEKINDISKETGYDIPDIDLEKIDSENLNLEKLDSKNVKEKIEDFGYDKKNLEKLNRLIEIISK